MPFLGTIVNCLTVLGGSLLGILLSRVFSKYHRLASVPDAAMKAISVFVIFIGAKGAMSSDKELVILLSLVIGTVIGTIINIDSLLERFGSFMERKFVRAKPQLTGHEELDGPRQQKSISKGFISTTLTCCVGALSIMGALNSGLEGDHRLLFTKAVLDFITAIVFASAFGGIGAMLSIVPIFLYQGAIELGAMALKDLLYASINEISATGSIIVIALGLNMVGATKIKIANMLPAIFLPIIFCLFM
ncbi:MAG: DUF554 domain-containing protein [Clostridia bacterium]|nr:DUF554 domain-containing protein [Clostridia bacterium]